jgi:hypothetical protein
MCFNTALPLYFRPKRSCGMVFVQLFVAKCHTKLQRLQNQISKRTKETTRNTIRKQNRSWRRDQLLILNCKNCTVHCILDTVGLSLYMDRHKYLQQEDYMLIPTTTLHMLRPMITGFFIYVHSLLSLSFKFIHLYTV